MSVWSHFIGRYTVTKSGGADKLKSLGVLEVGGSTLAA